MSERDLLRLEIESKRKKAEEQQKYVESILPIIDDLNKTLSHNQALIKKIKETGKNRKETFIKLLKDKKLIPQEYIESLENAVFAQTLYSDFSSKNQSKL